MADYSSLGIDKITKQANTDITLVRCPRDSVVMRPVECVLERPDTGERRRVRGRPPKGREWAVRELDLECPACRRRATRILVTANTTSRSTKPRHTLRPSERKPAFLGR